MVPNAGATMEEDTGEMNVNEETVKVAAHFRPLVQFFGFAGSSGPSQVTRLKSFIDREVSFFFNGGCPKGGWPFSKSLSLGSPP